MPWARFDDRFPSNRKIRLLSDGAFRLYVSAICWSAENLTDGVITKAELRLVADVKSPRTRAQELVEAGLWEELPGVGWRIHDYHDYNPTAEQVRADRKAKSARQQRWRARKSGENPTPDPPGGKANVDASTDASVDASRDASGDAAPRARVPDPTRPDLLVVDVGGVPTGSSPAEPPEPDGPPTPINDGFTLTEAMRRWATDTYGETLDLDYETAQFIDHYRGSRARRRNWPAEWQKWIRRSAKWASEGDKPKLRVVPEGHKPFQITTDPDAYANGF